MKITILTTLYPSDLSPYGGTFINERIKQLEKNNIPYQLYVILPKYSLLVKLAYRLIRGNKFPDPNPISWAQTKKTDIIEYSQTLFDIVVSRFTPKYEANKIYLSIERRLKRLDSNTILHAQYYYPLGFCVAKLARIKGIPCVITSHDSTAFTKIAKLSLSEKEEVYDTLSSADKIIYVTHANLNGAINEGCSDKNAIVISNGINPDYFYPLSKDEAMQKLGFHISKKYVVGFVGTLGYVKRADKFPEIFSEIQNEVNDVEFILIGAGIGENKLQKKFQELGLKVTIVGAIPPSEIVYWMNLFDVLILPSRHESWGCVVREAYACGVPVVGSNVEGLPEALGKLGYIVPDQKVGFEKKFALMVCEILTGKFEISKKELLNLASESVWEICVNKEIAVYQSISRMRFTNK